MNGQRASRENSIRERPLPNEVRVLIADGDRASGEEIADRLAAYDVRAFSTQSGADAIRAAEQEPPHLVILDFWLPDFTGLALSRLLRESPKLRDVPIMVVSALAGEMDRILAFEAGADDFLAKPFSAAELMARIRRLVRMRSEVHEEWGPSLPPPSPGLHLDRRAWRARIDGQELDVTIKEFEILWSLVERGGRVVRRRELIEALWGPEAKVTERVIDSHVKSIRRKLGDERDVIETVRGIGYRLRDTDAALIR